MGFGPRTWKWHGDNCIVCCMFGAVGTWGPPVGMPSVHVFERWPDSWRGPLRGRDGDGESGAGPDVPAADE
jgi:hypothetical protein